MIGDITQNNIHLIIPFKVSGLAEILMSQLGYTLTEAIKTIYSSSLYKNLAKEDTKYWHYGPVDLYNELQTELTK